MKVKEFNEVMKTMKEGYENIEHAGWFFINLTEKQLEKVGREFLKQGCPLVDGWFILSNGLKVRCNFDVPDAEPVKMINYFVKREEAQEFLNRFGFKYFVPYKKQGQEDNEDIRYYIKLTKTRDKIEYCCLEHIENGMVIHGTPFYDNQRMTIKNSDGTRTPRFSTAEMGQREHEYFEELIRDIQEHIAKDFENN